MHGASKARRAIVGFEQSHRAQLAELREPSFDQPRGMRMQDGDSFVGRDVRRHKLFGEVFCLGGSAAKHSVHESGSGRFSRAFNKLDGLVHRGARGNALEEAKLIEAEAQRERNRKIELCDRFLQQPFKQQIEQAAPAEHAERELGCERGIFGLHACAEFGVEYVAGVGALGFDATQRVKGDRSCGRNAHAQMKSQSRWRGIALLL
jgi:hypothetical protein